MGRRATMLLWLSAEAHAENPGPSAGRIAWASAPRADDCRARPWAWNASSERL